MKLILSALLVCVAAFSLSSCTNTQAGRGYRAYEVNSINSISQGSDGWVVQKSPDQTNLSYSNLAGPQPQ